MRTILARPKCMGHPPGMSMDTEGAVRIFVGDNAGPEGYVAFFEDTVGEEETPPGGYLYLEDRQREKIVRYLRIYKCQVEIKEEDVQIFWSSDGSKCGVAVW